MSDLTMRISYVLAGIDMNQPKEVTLGFMKTSDELHLNYVPRFGFRLGMLLRDIFGYNITWVFNNMWSETWSTGGALGEIRDDRVDQSTCLYAMDAPRLENIWVVFEAAKIRTTFFFLAYHNSEISVNRLAKPFHCTVWICVIVVLTVFSFGLREVLILERRLHHGRTSAPSFFSTMLSSFGTICQQSSLIIPRTLGGRLSCVFFLIASYLLYNYYTSSIVAFLLGPPVKSDIKTLRQLADSNLKVGLDDIPFTRAYLNYQEPEISYFIKKKIKPLKDEETVWLPADEGIQETRNRRFAYHCEVSVAYIFMDKYYTPDEVCDVNMVDLMSQKSLAILLKRGSPYRDAFKTK
ncbi:unnamed protein product [Hermetia illucens]|uniref:Ionotropic glutamate receptor C-terminal domain-containing protein n=2 Tax=Hermetia illucens TaxID=343691 RepID=A0A7R8UHT1_HERIL|nr:unnamed protein product [Hermetia illucens]